MAMNPSPAVALRTSVRLGLDALLQREHAAGKIERAADQDALRPRFDLVAALQRALDVRAPLGLEPDLARRLRKRLGRVRGLVRAGDGHRHHVAREPAEGSEEAGGI